MLFMIFIFCTDRPASRESRLVRQSRLSVMPISPAHWDEISRIGGWHE